LRLTTGLLFMGAAALAQEHEIRPGLKDASVLWARPALKLAEEITISGPAPGKLETRRIAKGGRFTLQGWQATDKLDRLTIELRKGFGPAEPGAIEIQMTGVDFDAQAIGPKMHFFTFHGAASGDDFAEQGKAPFFTLRAGQYKDKAGQRGIKVLWRGGGTRDEKAPFGVRAKWDPSATLHYRAEWTATELCVFLDGVRIFGPAEFHQRPAAAPLKHAFLSTDGIEREKWWGMTGPVYQRIRVFR